MDISNTLLEAQEKSYGWVFYRKPAEQEIRFICGPVSQVFTGEEAGRSFWVSPFQTDVLRIMPGYESVISASELQKTEFTVRPSSFQQVVEEPARFKQMVSDAVEKIEKGHFKKVVLSRVRKIALPEKFNLFQLYHRLTQAYSDAFVYLLFLPEKGLWMGSSPELLLSCENDSLETMSLAGTGKAPDDFTAKEIAEQEYVSEYITQVLSFFSDDIKREKLATKKAGEIYHLCTRIRAKRKVDAKLFDLVSALHPTPAVCGSPTDKAQDFIHKNEPHSRQLYSGFLGPVNAEDGSLFVNLRCMQIHAGEALLYAGAGIVSGSDPEAEWQETSQKMDTLLRVIFPGEEHGGK